MKISQQIRMRREALGMTMLELANRCEVSEQAVRHWENGRSFPGKSKSHLVEAALSFQLDWTEGRSYTGEPRGVSAMIDQRDIDLLMVIARLPLAAKEAIATLAKLHLAAVDEARGLQPAPDPDGGEPPQAAPQLPPASPPTRRMNYRVAPPPPEPEPPAKPPRRKR